jgi:hypothetical protein
MAKHPPSTGEGAHNPALRRKLFVMKNDTLFFGIMPYSFFSFMTLRLTLASTLMLHDCCR